MYNPLKRLLIAVFKVPPEPEDPYGDPSQLRVFRASSRYLAYRRVTWAIGQLVAFWFVGSFAFGILAAGFDVEEELVRYAIFAVAGLLIVGWMCLVLMSWMMLKLDYEMRWYKVTDRSLRIREGVVHVREMTMTFANIQNISVTQGPVQRLLGIADLRVQTAGGGGGAPQQGAQQGFGMHIGFFRGVDNVEEIRDLMIERLRKYRDAGLGDKGDRAEQSAPETPARDDAGACSAAQALLDEVRQLRAAVTPSDTIWDKA